MKGYSKGQSMRIMTFLFLVAMLPSAAAFAAEFLRGGYCQPAPEPDYEIEETKSILEEKDSASTTDNGNAGRSNDSTTIGQPKFVCDAFQGEVTVQDIYAKGWRVVGVLQAGEDMREYSAKRGLFRGEVRHREQKGAKGLVIEEQPKRKK
jgi:hypothetical protein